MEMDKQSSRQTSPPTLEGLKLEITLTREQWYTLIGSLIFCEEDVIAYKLGKQLLDYGLDGE